MDRLALKLTLKMIRIGCKHIEVLRRLPIKEINLRRELKLTKMPVNRKVHELMEVNLIQRKKKGMDLTETKTTKIFFKVFKRMEAQVTKNFDSIIENM